MLVCPLARIGDQQVLQLADALLASQRNEHNGWAPRDFWLEDWEKRAIIEFHDRYRLEGYRRLTFMMLDADVVAVSPASVWRVLHAGRRAAGALELQSLVEGLRLPAAALVAGALARGYFLRQYDG